MAIPLKQLIKVGDLMHAAPEIPPPGSGPCDTEICGPVGQFALGHRADQAGQAESRLERHGLPVAAQGGDHAG